MKLLAEALAHRGYDVSMVVYPVISPVEDLATRIVPNLTLVERPSRTAGSGILGMIREASR